MKSRQTLKKFLGRGWGFEVIPQVGNRQLPFVEGPQEGQAIHVDCIETEPGERLMRPDFGCGLRRYLMKPNTAATRSLIQRDVERALSAWEPRIQLQEVAVEPAEDPAMVNIHIHYTHVRDGSPGNLVYPFYLE